MTDKIERQDMRVVLGLDPGSLHTGFGLVEWYPREARIRHIEHGVLNVPTRLTFFEKLAFLSRELQNLFEVFKPQTTVVERIFLGKNADSAFKLGHVRGICIERAVTYGSEVAEYAARRVKKVVTGAGDADKDHVKLMVCQLLQVKTTAGLDATDALALAICHVREREQAHIKERLLGGGL